MFVNLVRPREGVIIFNLQKNVIKYLAQTSP